MPQTKTAKPYQVQLDTIMAAAAYLDNADADEARAILRTVTARAALRDPQDAIEAMRAMVAADNAGAQGIDAMRFGMFRMANRIIDLAGKLTAPAVEMNTCKDDPQCKRIVAEETADGERPVYVQVDATAGHTLYDDRTYRFTGVGSDVEFALDDAAAHAHAYLGDRAVIGAPLPQ